MDSAQCRFVTEIKRDWIDERRRCCCLVRMELNANAAVTSSTRDRHARAHVWLVVEHADS